MEITCNSEPLFFFYLYYLFSSQDITGPVIRDLCFAGCMFLVFKEVRELVMSGKPIASVFTAARDQRLKGFYVVNKFLA